MVKTGKKSKGNGRYSTVELEFELKHLRSQVRDVGENVILRREGEIETLISYIEQLPADQLKAYSATWLREVRQLKLKPHKGRLKDLKEIDRILSLLRDRFVDTQQKSVAATKKGVAKKRAVAKGAAATADSVKS